MLVAINENKEPALSFESKKTEGPFFCPDCGEPVFLKQGDEKIHHFSHFPDSSCGHGLGESEQHLLSKRDVFLLLKKNPAVKSVEIEKRIGNVISDVFFTRHDGEMCAIEIQITHTSADNISKKMSEYFISGIPVLWILQDSPYDEKWKKCIRIMSFGKSFWLRDGVVSCMKNDFDMKNVVDVACFSKFRVVGKYYQPLGFEIPNCLLWLPEECHLPKEFCSHIEECKSCESRNNSYCMKIAQSLSIYPFKKICGDDI